MKCDNSQGYSEVDCKYVHKVGTTYGKEESTSENHQMEYGASLGIEIGNLFSAKIGVSHTTG
jgi:hypothetical protein